MMLWTFRALKTLICALALPWILIWSLGDEGQNLAFAMGLSLLCLTQWGVQREANRLGVSSLDVVLFGGDEPELRDLKQKREEAASRRAA